MIFSEPSVLRLSLLATTLPSVVISNSIEVAILYPLGAAFSTNSYLPGFNSIFWGLSPLVHFWTTLSFDLSIICNSAFGNSFPRMSVLLNEILVSL